MLRHAIVLFLALLPHRWIGRFLATHTALPTELGGSAVWTSLVTALFLWASPASRLVRFGPPGWRDAWLGAGAGMLLFLLGAAGYVTSEAVLGLSRPAELSALTSFTDAGEIAMVAAAMIAAVVVEEVAFRGIVLGVLLREGGAVPAIALSAVAFSVYHLSAYQLLSTALYGVVLAGLVVWTGGLWPSVLAHLALNGLGVLLSLLARGHAGT